MKGNLLLLAFVAGAQGHGSMVYPLSRNAVDSLVGVNNQKCSNVTGDQCENGQAAFWYSQGCFIGCPTCDNASGRRQTDLCGLGKKQTLTDPKYWSVGRDAVPGSVLDVYKHNPWRAPGSAPTMDACGLAGGDYTKRKGKEAGEYIKTKFASHGDVGTKTLKPVPGHTAPTYKIGGTAEVAWSIRNNHGGGYQYRLCPLPENFEDLTEECFQAHPLDFMRDQQAIVFPNGTQLRLTPSQTTFVDQGTLPKGSTWSMIPMPPTFLGPCCIPGTNDTESTPNRCLAGEGHGGVDNCQATADNCAPCPETPGSDCSRCDQVKDVKADRYKRSGVPQFPEPCEGCSGITWNGFSVRDVVKIPSDLKAGKYILGWRYDCEATAQVWTNCADVTLEE